MLHMIVHIVMHVINNVWLGLVVSDGQSNDHRLDGF